MRELLLEHVRRFPCLTLQDIAKFLYQIHMGPGHLIPDPAQALSLLIEEWEPLTPDPGVPLSEPLDGKLCRLNLRACKAAGISPQAVNRLFCATASGIAGDPAALDRDLELVRDLPFSNLEIEAFLVQYRHLGLPPQHHSQAFRSVYHPAYRVVDSRYLPYLSLATCIEELMTQQPQVYLAIDGPCASGKTTLAALLQEVYDCPVVHMDHFFLPPHLREPQRLAQPGGNVDYLRFQDEVFRPLMAGVSFSYYPWSCRTAAFGEPISIPASPLTVVEGCYSLRPELQSGYHLRVFLTAPWPLREKRLLARGGAKGLRQFVQTWIPLEDAYFSACRVQACCHLTLESPNL